ncbi:cell adhesion molecule Dscam2-like [Centruroides vittatus]|uniref:cell adhesion molecule Dscam2-like n=1 Tax=Centruroides vittatus TaxID=120091 RepID=UPI00350FCAF1
MCVKMNIFRYLFVAVSFSVIMAEEIPKIKPFSFQGKVTVGDKTIATCLVTTTTGSLQFIWLKDGHDIESMKEVKVKNEKHYSFILIDPVLITSKGNYTCIVSNDLGKDSYTTELQVEDSPKWIEEPSDTSAILDSSISLICNASGSPKPRITWEKFTGPNLNIYTRLFNKIF